VKENAKTPTITIDLNQFKLHVEIKNKIELTLHFNSPSRRFYLSVIALVVNEMKRQGKITSIPLEGHHDLLALLNETIGGSAGLSEKEHLLPRIYRKWQHALPNLEEAPLFTVLGKKKGYEEGIGKTYHFTEAEKDIWANLFEYKGSEENVRLKFSIDRIGAGLDDVEIIHEDLLDADAWERFLSSVKGRVESIPETETTPVPSEAPGPSASVPKEKGTAWQGRLRWVALVTVIVVFMGVGTLAFWKLYLEPGRLKRASEERMGFPLPEKPSIAVLPFTNMSDDPQQEHFCDGISDDIITDLSKLSGLIVIARNSSFTYKGQRISAQQIGQDLNVRYLLEGSARRAGDRVRINAQLVDASTGQHLWAERYEGRANDIFAVQDGITRKIVTALALKLTASEQEALADKGTDNPLAYDQYIKGWENYRQYTNESFARARFHLEKAIELDPEFSRAYAALAVLYWKAVQTVGFKRGLELTDPRKVMLASLKSRDLLHKAMKKPTTLSHGLMSQYYLNMFLHNEALAEIEQAVEMDPNNPELHAWMSKILWLMGKDKEAIESAKRAIRLDPKNPAGYLISQAMAYLPDGDLEESLTLLERAKILNPELSGAIGLQQSIIYGLQGQTEKARAAYEIFRKSLVCPDKTVTELMAMYPFTDLKKSDRIAEALVKAGATGNSTDYCKVSRSNLLKGPEIKNLLFGHKITAIDPTTGERFSLEWDKNGESIFVQGAFRDKGKCWIEGDVLFGRLEKVTGGLLFTEIAFRNPGGTKEQTNQYFFVNYARVVYYFSPAD
jgi:adenylate cyclase